MILVDTSAWFAAIVPTDADYHHATRRLSANSERLLTTDYVIDETLTLLRARGERQRAQMIGERFFESSMTEVYFLTDDDIRQAWGVFHQYADKGWSFTDCASKVVIEQMNISEAFTFDHHFNQFGSVRVVPNG